MVLFSQKCAHPFYATVHAVMLSKKHRSSSTVQEEGLRNEGRHHLLLLRKQASKQAHDKRGIAESLHAQLTRARLIACEVGVFSREISQLSKIRPPLSLGSHLSSSPMGVFSRDYGSHCQLKNKHIFLSLGNVSFVEIASLATLKFYIPIGSSC